LPTGALLATAARLCVHLDIERARTIIHKAEAAFKALALALREAVSVSGFADVPSTKGHWECRSDASGHPRLRDRERGIRHQRVPGARLRARRHP
jgi:hypothetical protein